MKTIAETVRRRFRQAFASGRNLLPRLWSDQHGNVLVLTAAMLVPLIALVGSAIDIGRYQMVKARLQSACDAGVLAGRRAMTGGNVDDTVRAETLRFFNFNFPQASFKTAGFVPVVNSLAGSNQTVVLTANTTLPMSVMRFFGYTTMPLAVSCNAKQDFVNTDIILVLDTTGSMNDNAPGDTETKIVALRKAVLAFFDQLKPVQDQLAAAGLRLRYGIVPYSSAVNIGKVLRGVDPNSMVSDEWRYQSREVTPRTCYNRGGSYDCSYFTYGPRDIDVSSYIAGNAVDITPIIANDDSKGNYVAGSSRQLVTWKGCIEERQTTRMASTAASIPQGAYDLDIDRKPTDDASRWKPYWPEISYTTTSKTGPQTACPSEAVRLKVWDRTSLNTYLNKLTPDGGTYHDNGMMWGARLGSANGVFSADNPSFYNGLQVKRFIVFMTDGLFDTGYDGLYTGYGIERYDARVTPGGSQSNESDQLERHKNRFNLLCSRAKSMGYQIWVLAFAQTPDASLTNCASNASQASGSANAAALTAKFVEIGKNIGSLRLSQ